MPLRLIAPREGRSQNYRVRGTYLGVYVDRSAQTADREVAARQLRQIRRQIESGELAAPGEATFLSAAVAYMAAGGERLYLAKLVDHFGAMPLRAIDQSAVDMAAHTLYPGGGPATRNRQVYTPVAAVVHHSGHPWIKLRRPAQPAGRVKWLTPDQAAALIEVADLRLAALVTFLIYTGCRLSEALRLEWSAIDGDHAYVNETKNDEPRGVHLPPIVVAALGSLSPDGDRVFGWRTRGAVYKPWRAALIAAGLTGFTPHDLRHTYATWMRRYAGLDLRGLLGTGAWKDLKSVLRYQHVVASEESRKADLLPGQSVQNPGTQARPQGRSSG